MGHAKKERVLLFGTDQRITSGPAAKRLRSKAGYMAAPERFAQSQIPLAPRAPSIHGPSRRFHKFGPGPLLVEPNIRYSMISSARSRIDCGTVRPSALAIFRLTTNSNFVGN